MKRVTRCVAKMIRTTWSARRETDTERYYNGETERPPSTRFVLSAKRGERPLLCAATQVNLRRG
jgi:hypothetical protein